MDDISLPGLQGRPPSLAWVLAVASFSAILFPLDRAMVILALPSIGADIGPAAAAELVSLYLLVCGGFLLAGGRLCDAFGYRAVFITGAGVFALSSLVCAFSRSVDVLAVARGAQALGSAVFVVGPNALALKSCMNPSQRARALSLVNGVGGIAQSAGPFAAGGVLVMASGWHGLFLVNVAVGAVVMMMSFLSLPLETSPTAGNRSDLVSALLLILALLLGGFVITEGEESRLGPRYTVTLIVSAAATALWFLHRDSRAAQPLLPLDLLRDRYFRFASIAGALLGATTYAAYLVYPAYLQRVLGFSPLDVALVLLPLNLVPAVFGFGILPKLVARLGTARSATTGVLFIAVGLIALVRTPADGHITLDVLPSMFVVATGLGIAPVSLFIVATDGMAKERVGLAAGAYITAYVVGGGLGVAILGRLASVPEGRLNVSDASLHAALNTSCHVIAESGALLACAVAVIVMSLQRSKQLAIPPRGR